jgi:hypothetical protein
LALYHIEDRMPSNDIMLSTSDSILNTEIKNKGFALLDQLFKEHGWHMVKNEPNWICYTKFAHETDLFDIKIDSKSIHVSVPIRNSPFQYMSSFKDYYQASEYVEARFLDFIGTPK